MKGRKLKQIPEIPSMSTATTYADIAHLEPAQKRALLERLLREKERKPKASALSFAQQRLWFLDKLQPGTAIYNVPSVLKLTGPIQLDAFQAGRR